MAEQEQEYIGVNKVDAFISPMSGVPVIVCYLEDGREFNLFYVPPDIVNAINKLMKNESNDSGNQSELARRETVYDIISFIPEIIDELQKRVTQVTIDDILDDIYLATVELNFGGLIIQKRMIPSHAIYLALLTGKPIRVKKELVDRSAERSNKS
ncbi:bifunctional nuclease family protein [Metallosphaera hakonensis]|uniref:BFN domain-containing protein n=1 Tax=Metallosphaera hakonensis JCM 8857 = DSM 7519 TaxID=1293036 RepID=A0A2U9IU46_9CREN|nr:bifunctional nuclease domain-containing protein [Metallosphaera hakonensis]AWR99503.1 bifunctional nuclease family protein [Metallosphaera hakonensis JCM 8857 = DSM 7519]